MQFCPNCGRKLDDDATFCSECGFDIKNNKSPTIKSSDNEILVNNGLVIGGLIVAAIVILLIVLAMSTSHIETINGVDFNIPAGYSKVNETDGGDTYIYKNSDNDCFLITVKFESKSWLNEMSKDALYSRKFIDGTEGWIKEPFDVYSSYMFVYYDKNTGNEVTICTSSESLIEEIIT